MSSTNTPPRPAVLNLLWTTFTTMADGAIEGRVQYAARTDQSPRTLAITHCHVWKIAAHPMRPAVACACDDGAIRVIDMSSYTVDEVSGHKTRAWNVVYDFKGQLLATCGNDKLVIVRKAAAPYTAIHTLQGHEGSVRGLAFSPDGVQLASSSLDGRVLVWLVESGSLQFTLRPPAVGPLVSTLAVIFTPDSSMLVTAGQDETVRVWLTSTGQETACIMQHVGITRALAISSSNTYLAYGGQNYDICIHAFRRLRPRALHTVKCDSIVNALAFPKNTESTIAAVCESGSARVVDFISETVIWLHQGSGQSWGAAFIDESVFAAHRLAILEGKELSNFNT